MRKPVLVAFGILPLLVAACGGGGDDVATPNDDGVVEITMKDNSFDPDEVEVEAGQTVTFRFRNEGDVEHDAFIGTEAEQADHESEMNPGGSEDDDAGHSGDAMNETDTSGGELPDEEHGEGMPGEPAGSADVSVVPGDSATLEYTFDEAGTLVIGCHEPGHYEEGMKMEVVAT